MTLSKIGKSIFPFLMCLVAAIGSFHIMQLDVVAQFLSLSGALTLANVTFVPNVYDGTRFQEYFSELILRNKTQEKRLVRYMPGIKFKETVSTISGEVTLQPYTSDVPTPQGSFNVGDAYIQPTLMTVYDEFDPNQIRQTVFSEDMTAGVSNMESNKWNQQLLMWMQKKIATAIEKSFWSSFTQAWKNAVALAGNSAFTTAGEKTFAAARTAGMIDGVVARLIFDTMLETPADVPTILVTGTTLTEANVAAEFAKLYLALPTELIESPGECCIFASYKVRQFIHVLNTNQTYRDLFGISGMGESAVYTYNGYPIEFVPLPDNVMVAGLKSDFVWGTDLEADYGQIEINRIANNSKKMFYRADFSLAAAVCVCKQKVLYFA